MRPGRPQQRRQEHLLEAIRRVLGGGWLRVTDFSQDDVYLRDTERDIEIACTLDPPLQYVKFRNAPPAAVHTLSFQYTRYKVGENKGQPRLDQKYLDADGRAPMVLGKAPKRGEQHKYEPLVGVPSEVRDQVPLIHIGTNRSLHEQLPGARFSMLRRLF